MFLTIVALALLSTVQAARRSAEVERLAQEGQPALAGPVSDDGLRIQADSAPSLWLRSDLAATALVTLLISGLVAFTVRRAESRRTLRWMTDLERTARACSDGSYTQSPVADAAGAPPQVRYIVLVLGEMARNIQERERSLSEARDQRTMMLREIHHRVKNNLQIIGSLLQIEVRRVKEPAARAALLATQTRINAIALAHRVLEEVGTQTAVNLRRLVIDLSHMLQDTLGAPFGGEVIAVESPDLLIETNIAVPLSLLLAEQVGIIALDAIAAGQGALGLSLRITGNAPMLDLEIAFDDPSALAGGRKLTAFAQAYVKQLRAEYACESQGGRSATRFSFPQHDGETAGEVRSGRP